MIMIQITDYKTMIMILIRINIQHTFFFPDVMTSWLYTLHPTAAYTYALYDKLHADKVTECRYDHSAQP